MHWTTSVYTVLLSGLFLAYVTALVIEAELRDHYHRKLFLKWLRQGTLGMIASLYIFLALFVFGSTKQEEQQQGESQPMAGSESYFEGGAQTLTSGPDLTAAQLAACFALLPTTVTNTAPWPAVPSNAVVHAPWTRYGLAEDTFWLPATDWGFVIGTNAVEGVHVSSSGVLAFQRRLPKGSPRAREMPDGDALSFLAPLQADLGTVPPRGRFWHAVTGSNSVLMTWEELCAGRDTNSPVTFQTELFGNGDFTYRYAFTNALALTNFVVGAQHNGGGETYAFSDTNLLVNGLELHWRAFGMLDPNETDHDGDGLSTYDEVMKLGTDPSMPDTDLDGLSDNIENDTTGLNPLIRDIDGDGIPDGSDPDPFNPDDEDDDSDGLSDAWEIRWFGSTNVTDSADVDFNGNGASNLADLLEGVDPSFAACAVTTSQGLHLFTWTALPGATNYEASVSNQSETVWSCVTNVCSLSVTGDFTSAVHTFAVTAYCTNAVATHTATATFRQPSQPNLTVWKIAAPFAFGPASDGAVALERTFRIDRVREWQQYFISSGYDSAGPWALEGLQLEWADDTGAAGTNSVSPSGDSLMLDLGADAGTLTVRLAATRDGTGWSRRPLYLIGWSPAITFDTNAVFIATTNGPALVVVSALDNSPTGPGFTVDTAGRPHNAELTERETEALSDPFGDGGGTFSASTDVNGLLTGGTFNAGAAGVYSAMAAGGGGGEGAGGGGGGGGQPLPPGPGAGSFNRCVIAPAVSHKADTGFCGCPESGADAYPFDTACLRTAWQNAGGCRTRDFAGFSFSLGDGVPNGYYTITINNHTYTNAVAAYTWAGDERSAAVAVILAGETVWSATVDREPELQDMACADKTWAGGDCGSCGDCGSGDCSSSEGDGFGSVRFRVPLGFTGYKQTAGFVWFDMETPQAVTPALFRITADEYTVTNLNATGALTNAVRYGPGGRDVRIAPTNSGVCVSVRDTGDADPDRTWTITYEAGVIHFVKRDSAGNSLRDVSYRQTWSGYGHWTRTDNSTQLTETRYRYGNVTNDTEHVETCIRDAAWLKLDELNVERKLIGTGTAAAVREIQRAEWDGLAQAWRYTHMTYWTDSLNPLLNGRPKFRYGDGGGWEYRAHDARGRETLRVEPLDGSGHPFFKDYAEPFAFSPSGSYGPLTGLVTVTSYALPQDDGDGLNDSRKPREISRYAVRGGAPRLVAHEWRVYTRGVADGYPTVTQRVTRAASQASGPADADNARSLTVSIAEDDDTVAVLLRGRPLCEEREDGTLLTWEYAPGANTLTVTSRRGTTALPDGLANVSTFEVETLDAVFGRTLSRETRLYTGGAGGIVLSSETRSYDSAGRLLTTVYSDGTAETNVWDCCHLQSKIGRDGTRVEYISEPGNEHKSVTGESSLGNLPGANGLYPAVETFTDALGRETNSVRRVYSGLNPAGTYAGLSTRTEYPYGTDNCRVTTDPLGVQIVSSRYYGGDCEIEETSTAGVTNRTTQVWGGATIGEKLWDGKWTRETRSASNNIDGCRVETVTSEASDMPGPVVTTETVYDFLGLVVSVTTPMGVISNVYENGRLALVTRTSSPDTLYVYDALGSVTATALDVDNDGQVSYAGDDRVSATDTRYEEISNEWWRVTSSVVWNQTGVDASLTASVSRVRMTGFGGAAPSPLPAGAILTAQSETFDWRCNLTRTSTYSDAGSAAVWQVTETPFSNRPVLQKVVGGSPVSAVSASCVTNTFAFDGFARQTAVTDGRGNTSRTFYDALGQIEYTENAASNRTAYAYDELGRQISVSAPLSNTVFTAYDSLGNVIRTWGATYPVEYGYDTRGRKVSMKTFRDENGAGDETRWLYSDVTGLLTNKVYADGKGTAYAYTLSGRIASRVWARGVTTGYAYDALGQLVGIDYSDSTPDAVFSYDRLGRQTSALTSVSTNLFEYNGFSLVTETQNGGKLDHKYDLKGRPYILYVNGVGPTGADWLDTFDEILYTDYDGLGRLVLVCGGVSYDNYTVCDYGYLAGSDTLQNMASVNFANYSSAAGVGWTRTFEPNRDLITAVSNFWDTSLISAYAYENDALGRRTARNDFDGSVYTANSFGYNAKSEVTVAVMGTNTYGFVYDQIGNRIAATNDAETFAYFSNALNQYTNVTDGVTVLPAYDDDGNMVSYGPWSYTWDAENRLASVLSNSVLVVTNAYDHMSRRVAKVSGGTQRTFLYDGWNPLREISLSTSGASTNYYTWGPDLSGSLQGAGGVGGLLAVTRGDGGVFFPTYDANGNVTAYVDGSGSVVAQRENDAFGNTVSETVAAGLHLPFWFSTKYLDDETRMYYYGYRFYSPVLGRWTGRDPLEELSCSLLYGFIGNDPANKYDVIGMFNLPNNDFGKWVARFQNGVFPTAPAAALFVLWVNKEGGDDPWILPFIWNYFAGNEGVMSLDSSQVHQLYFGIVPPIDFTTLSGFFDADGKVAGVYSGLEVNGLGPGNKTLGDFSIKYRGRVNCHREFVGDFQIYDTFDFELQWPWKSTHGFMAEMEVWALYFSTVGRKFDVSSEWVPIRQTKDQHPAKW